MPIPPGRHTLGPDDGTLTVRTGRTGAASKAGHDLLIEVTSWRATLDLDGGEPAVTLTADARSLRVQRGTGGMKALGDEDKANIHQTIDDEVLQRRDIAFRSTSVDGGWADGELTLGDRTRPLSVALTVADDGTVNGRATVKQSDWDMKPYSALFGTLKVLDEVEIKLQGHL